MKLNMYPPVYNNKKKKKKKKNGTEQKIMFKIPKSSV